MSDLLKTNSFKVVGKLLSQNMKAAHKKTDGSGYISGTITVGSHLDGADCEYEIVLYANQMTKEGKESQLYTNYSKLEDLVGKKIEVTGDLREQRYYSTKNSQMVSFQQLNGRFIKGVAETTADEATYEVGGFVVDSLKEKTNKENAIYRYDLTLGQASYDNSMMSRIVVHVNPADKEIVNGARGYQIGQTVKVNGNLRFTVEKVTATVNNDGGFGDPIVRTFTNRQYNYYVTGGSASITDIEKGMYPQDVIRNLVNAYKARDVELANKAKTANAGNTAVEETPVVTSKQASLI